MFTLRKVRDGDEARSLLSEAESAGVDRAGWARSRGVDPRSLNAWRLNLSRGKRTFVPPLRVVELVPSAEYRASDVGCRIRREDWIIEVDAGFDEATLVRVLRAVRGC